MGLMDIKGDKCFDVFADVLGPMLNIATDEEAMAYFKVQEVPEGEDPGEYAVKRTRDLLPVVLKKHKDDLIDIMAALEGKDRKEYLKDLTVPGLMQSIMALASDPAFRAFLA